MFSVKAPRELRNKKSQHSVLAASDCWGNVSVLVDKTARACGFSSDITLCKKNIDESNNVIKTAVFLSAVLKTPARVLLFFALSAFFQFFTRPKQLITLEQ